MYRWKRGAVRYSQLTHKHINEKKMKNITRKKCVDTFEYLYIAFRWPKDSHYALLQAYVYTKGAPFTTIWV